MMWQGGMSWWMLETLYISTCSVVSSGISFINKMLFLSKKMYANFGGIFILTIFQSTSHINEDINYHINCFLNFNIWYCKFYLKQFKRNVMKLGLELKELLLNTNNKVPNPSYVYLLCFWDPDLSREVSLPYLIWICLVFWGAWPLAWRVYRTSCPDPLLQTNL